MRIHMGFQYTYWGWIDVDGESMEAGGPRVDKLWEVVQAAAKAHGCRLCTDFVLHLPLFFTGETWAVDEATEEEEKRRVLWDSVFPPHSRYHHTVLAQRRPENG